MLGGYKKLIIFLVIAGITVGVFSIVKAAFNPQINYQGKLTDTNNVAVANGDYNIEFKIWNNETATSGEYLIWTETCTSSNRVTITSGLFSHLLGSVNSLSSVDFNQTLWLGVNIGEASTTPSWDGEMTPRKKLGVVPAAFIAEKIGDYGTSSIAILSESETITGAWTFNNIVSISASTTSSVLTVRQDGSGNIVEFKDAGTSVFTISDGGDVSIVGNVTLAADKWLKLTGGTSFPTSTSPGQMFFKTDTQQLYVYASSTAKQGWQADRTVATKIVAATSSQNYEKADYVCAGASCEDEINSAFSALPSTGGVVYLLEGTYNIATSTGNLYGIQIAKSNVTLIGSGKATVLKRMWNETALYYSGVITVGDGTNPYEGIFISQLQIDGNKGTFTSTDNHAIFFKQKISRSQIKSTWIYNNGGEGICLYAASATSSNSYNIIEGNEVRDNYYGVDLTYSSSTIIANNTVQGNSEDGIYIVSSNNNNITGNIVSENGWEAGIYVYDSFNNNISNNVVQWNGGPGIYIYETTESSIANNISRGNDKEGIALNNNANNNSVTGNTLQENDLNGILLTGGANDNVVSGNKIYDNGGNGDFAGIEITGSSNNNLISSNDITDTDGTSYAINIVFSNCSNNYLVGNRYSGTGASSIRDLGTGTIYGSQLYGTSTVADLILKPLGNIGIGSTSTSAKLTVLESGSGTIVDIKNATGSVFTIANIGNVTVAGNILPATTTTYTLGSSSYRWANIYVATTTIGDTITIGTDSISATSTLTISTDNSAHIILSPSGYVGIGTTAPKEKLTLGANGNILLESGYLTSPFGGFGIYSNLLLKSEGFNYASWTKSNTTVTANNTTSSDGQVTADKLDATVANGYVEQSYDTGSALTGRTFTFSVWLKADSAKTSRLKILSATTTPGSETHLVTTSWQRFSLPATFGTDTTTTVKVQIIPVDAGTGAIYAWGAQLEENSSAGSYLATDETRLTTPQYGLTAPGDSVMIGKYAIAGGSSAIALGPWSSASAIRSIALGHGADAKGDEAVVIGSNATADTGSNYSVVIGEGSYASGYGAIALGVGSVATGANYASALGYAAEAETEWATALGYSAQVTGEGATALGSVAVADGDYSTAVGRYTEAWGTSSTALGDYAEAGNYSSTLGADTSVSSNYSIGIGYDADIVSGADYSATFGYQAKVINAAHDYAFVFGRGTNSGGANQFIIGNATYPMNVGIGTTSPTSILTIQGTSTTPLLNVVASSTVSALYVSNTGNVGIGTTSPGSYKLYVDAGGSGNAGIGVDGYIKATGSITGTTTLDLAERFPIDPQCQDNNNCPEAGDVVVVKKDNERQSFHIEKSTESYNKKLIGVVSTNPGFILGGGLNENNSRLVALVGRVPVKVSTENGPIEIGDYLTSASSTPGVAMKATGAGRIIGSALEPFSGDDEDGKITVFINPHWQGDDLSIAQNIEGQIVNISSEELRTGLASLGLIVAENGSLETQKLKSQELCIGEVCLDENQLRALLENAGINVDANAGTSNSTGGADCTPIYYYYDGDGDGYGYIQGSFQITCVQPDGHVPNNNDCNDDNPNINPEIAEVCDDDIDNDCDGIVDNPDICQTETTEPPVEEEPVGEEPPVEEPLVEGLTSEEPAPEEPPMEELIPEPVSESEPEHESELDTEIPTE